MNDEKRNISYLTATRDNAPVFLCVNIPKWKVSNHAKRKGNGMNSCKDNQVKL